MKKGEKALVGVLLGGLEPSAQLKSVETDIVWRCLIVVARKLHGVYERKDQIALVGLLTQGRLSAQLVGRVLGHGRKAKGYALGLATRHPKIVRLRGNDEKYKSRNRYLLTLPWR